MDLCGIVDTVALKTSKACDRDGLVTYISPLARIFPEKFGLPNGSMHAAGDADEAFSVQSISKVFALTLALKGRRR
jgi:glutaminase